MDEKSYSVYAVKCNMTGRVYIGSSSNVERRIEQHYRELLHGNKAKNTFSFRSASGELWQSDFEKYGPDSFDAYVLETGISPGAIKQKEDEWIETYHARNPKYGYNIQRVTAKTWKVLPGKPKTPEELGVMSETDDSEEIRITTKRKPLSPFWINFSRLCQENGVSPNKVASECGFRSRGTVTYWKNGTMPRQGAVLLIADYFGVDASELIVPRKKRGKREQ